MTTDTNPPPTSTASANTPEWPAALYALRACYRESRDLFSPREMARRAWATADGGPGSPPKALLDMRIVQRQPLIRLVVALVASGLVACVTSRLGTAAVIVVLVVALSMIVFVALTIAPDVIALRRGPVSAF